MSARGGGSMNQQVMDRNLALELLRVTEGAALAAAPLQGRGVKEEADRRAVDAMRSGLGSVDMRGVVVIGEGEKDEAPMLYFGEEVGNGLEPEVDVAVDPIDGTEFTANGLPGAMSVVALAERGSMFTTHVGRFPYQGAPPRDTPRRNTETKPPEHPSG